MTPRWAQVLATLRERFPTESDIAELASFLESSGLSRQEIGEILSLYLAEAGVVSEAIPNVLLSAPRTALRVQGPHERGRFTTEAWGVLVMLHDSGMMAPLDFEQLVDRALGHVDGPIGLPEIRAIADEGGLNYAMLSTDPTLLH